jgi:hypothetical protein
MLINVLTRKLRRAVRLHDGDVLTVPGDAPQVDGARPFVALSA